MSHFNIFLATGIRDKRGNLESVIGDQTYRRDYSYDGLSRMVTLTTFDTSTSVTTWTYNPLRGWLDSKDYPDLTIPTQAGMVPATPTPTEDGSKPASGLVV